MSDPNSHFDANPFAADLAGIPTSATFASEANGLAGQTPQNAAEQALPLAPNIVGAINTAEARLLANPDLDHTDSQVISLRERLGGAALKGNHFAIVVGEDDQGNETAISYVNVGISDLGTRINPNSYERFGLKDPKEALQGFHQAAEQIDSPLSQADIQEVHKFYRDVESTAAQSLYDAHLKQEAIDGDLHSHTLSIFNYIETTGGSKVSQAIVGAMAAGSIKNPDITVSILNVMDSSSLLDGESSRVLHDIANMVARINNTPGPKKEKLYAINNVLSGTLHAIQPTQKKLRRIVLAYAAGTTLENQPVSAGYMNGLDSLLS